MATITDRYVLELDVNGALGGLNNLKSSLGSLAALKTGPIAIATGVLAIATAAAAASAAMIQASRAIAPVVQQLQLVTTGTGDLLQVQQKLRDVVATSGGSFADLATLYTKVTLATEGLGKSQDDVVQFTKNFSIALQIAGADAGTAAGVITQLGQAMGSGVVRGDEFNSIAEALGPALAIMARESGYTVAELKKMANAGELNSEVFFEMFQNTTALAEAQEKMGKTAAQVEQQLTEGFNRATVAAANLVDEIFNFSGLYKGILEIGVAGLNNVATSLENLTLGLSLASADINSGNIDQVITDYKNIAAIMEEVVKRQKLVDMAIESNESWLGSLLDWGTDTVAGLKETRAELDSIYESLSRASIAQGESAANAALRAAIEEPYKNSLDAINKMREANAANTTELEKALAVQSEAAKVVEDMQNLIAQAQAESATGAYSAEQIAGLKENLKVAEQYYDMLTQKVLDFGTVSKDAFGEYYSGLVEGAAKSAESADFAVQAQTRLIEQLNSGAISIDTYAFAMDSLNLSMDTAPIETFATYMEDLNKSIADAAVQSGFQSQAIDDLNAKFANGTVGLTEYKMALDAIGGSFEDQMIKTNNIGKYMEDLQAQISNSIAADEFKAQAVAKLNEQYGKDDNLQRYSAGMELLGERVADTSGAIKDSSEWMLRLEQSTADAQTGFDNLNMSKLDQDISASASKIKNELAREIQALQEIQNTANYDVIQSQIDALVSAADTAIEKQSELARKSSEYQRSFTYGWSQAFQEYSDSATNAAETAGRVFQTATSGMEDMLFKFAKTGKLSWKEYGQSIVDELLKANIKQVVAGFWGSGVGKGIGGILGALTGNPDMAKEMTMGKPDGTSSNPLHVVANGLNDAISGMGSGVASAASGAFGGLGTTMSNVFGGVYKSITSVFGGFGNSLSGLFGNLFGGLTGGLGNLFGGFGSTLGNLFGGVSSGLSSMFGGFSSTLGGLFSSMGGQSSNNTGGGGGLFSGIASLFGGGGNTKSGSNSGGGGFFSGIANTISNVAKGAGKLFGGFFATGGMIPPGRFGVVGENGPEYVSGPANITPMQPMQVTYIINAVDSRSFKEMVAADPGFIHSVAQMGARTIPGYR